MISIALCTYNGEKYIKEQLESIINQSLPPDEIIICDDCSKDNTEVEVKSVLENWKGSWKFIINEKNLGYKKNFEKAISLCKGDIIFLSDQDDVWLSLKIKRTMDVFNENPDCVMAFHDAKVVNSHLEMLYPSFWKLLGFNPDKFLIGDYGILLDHNVVQGSACAFRKSLFNISTPFPNEVIHDEWLTLNALTLSKGIMPINKCFSLYRQSDSNSIGARNLPINVKLKVWLKSYHKSLTNHYKEIIRRGKAFETLSYRYGAEDILLGERLDRYCKFYEFRKEALDSHNFLLVFMIKDYFRFYYSFSYSVKEYIEDILALASHIEK